MIRTLGLGMGAVGLGVLLAAGCRDAAGPVPVLSYHRAVYSVLEVESSLVRVLAEELLDSGGRPLRGAQGAVTGEYGSAPLTEAALGLSPCFAVDAPGLGPGDGGCYAGLLPQPAGASETLTLDLVLADGGEVRGALVTPEPPLASIPPDSQRVSVAFQALPIDALPIAIVPIVLEAAPGAERVDVVTTVEQAFRGGGGEMIDPAGCEVQASAAPFRWPQLQGQHDLYLYQVTCRPSGSVIPWDSLDLAVHVISMERNYAMYMERVLGSSSIDATRAGFGIEGAVGVFGAVATTILPLRVVFEP